MISEPNDAIDHLKGVTQEPFLAKTHVALIAYTGPFLPTL